MGAGSSFTVPPEGIDSDTFKQLFPEHFSHALFRELASGSGRIAASELQEFALQATDVFLTHDWGTDELGRSNHKRVSEINRALKERGVRAWFDEQEMKGNIQEEMQRGIDRASCILVFVTDNYIKKVAGKGSNGDKDNCRFEFNYISVTKSPRMIIPVVMEPRCRDNTAWYGPVSAQLRSKLYVDFASDDVVEAAVDHIIREIRTHIAVLVRERVAMAIEFSNKSPEPVPLSTNTDAIVSKSNCESTLFQDVSKDDPAAMFKLGRRYETGDGVDKDIAEALRCYWDAAEKGNADAQFALGVCYEEGKGVKRDATEAFKFYEKAAKNKSIHLLAMRRVAECFKNGTGVDGSDSEAFFWYQVAAESGDVEAYMHVGECFKDGIGIAEDAEEAFEAYLQAAKLGSAKAQRRVADCYQNNIGVIASASEAFDWLVKAGESGDVESQFRVGMSYLEGVGVSVDKDKALEWFMKPIHSDAPKNEVIKVKTSLKGAMKGQAEAQLRLGELFEKGIGVVQNDKIAYEWYRLAAEQGCIEAQRCVGHCFRDGRGTAEDSDIAAVWYERAAIQGDMKAQCCLGIYYTDSAENTEEIRGKAFQWFTKAAAQGDPEGKYQLARCYDDGRGVERDKEEAMRWYHKAATADALYQIATNTPEEESFKWWLAAAEKGHTFAQYKVALCYAKGILTRTNKSEAFKWYLKAAQGDCVYYCNVAQFYEFGVGVEQNYAEALRCYLKATESDNYSSCEEAWCEVARCYYDGIGVPKDRDAARECYLKAITADAGNHALASKHVRFAVQGDADSQYELAELFRQGTRCFTSSFLCALSWYLEAARQGHALAQLKAGEYYEEEEELTFDKGKAFEWYLKAAEQGQVKAQFKVGAMYEKGDGIDKNLELAFSWYRKAAGQEHEGAIHTIGMWYHKGVFVERNNDEALNWLRKCDFGEDYTTNIEAALQGDPRAQYKVAEAMNEKFDDGRFDWYMLSAQQGWSMFAVQMVGACYEYGWGVRRDKQEAEKWYRKSREQGYDDI